MTTRPLDPTEVYYEVVDRLWPMNSIGFIEVEGSYDRAQVEAAWATIVEQVPIVGSRVVRTGPREAHLDFDARLPGSVCEFTDEPTMLADLASCRLPLDGPLARCAVSFGDGGATLAIAISHAVLDGRPLVQLLMLLARVLVDGADPAGHPLTAPTEPVGRFLLPERDWNLKRREMLTTAREIRAESGFAGNGAVPDWYRRDIDGERALVCTLFDLEPDEVKGLIGWSKASGATVHGALSAALLKTIARLTPGPTRFPLSTAVDLRVRAAEPAVDVVGQSAAVIASSFDVTLDTAALACQVSTDIARRVERGEPELFFALSGVERQPIGEATDRVVLEWMKAATPAVNLSNLGVVTGDAPESARRLGAILAPTPNQVLFIATTTFRGRVTAALCFDRNRLAIEPSEFTDTLRAELATLTG